MSTSSLYSTIPLLSDIDALTALGGVDLYGMEDLPLRRAMLASNGLEDHCSLQPLQEAAMDYDHELAFHDSPTLCKLSQMDLQVPETVFDDQSVSQDDGLHDSGYLDNGVMLTELTNHCREFSPGSTGDSGYEQELSDSGSSDLESQTVIWEPVCESGPYDTTLPDVTIFSRLPPPPTDDFLGRGHNRPMPRLVKEEELSSDDDSLQSSSPPALALGPPPYPHCHRHNHYNNHVTNHVNNHDYTQRTAADENNNYGAAVKAEASSGAVDRTQRKKPGRKKGQVSKVLHLWEFIRDLLGDSNYCPRIISWENEKEGVFRVVHSNEVAKLWGEKKKNKKTMTYEKLSRSLRYSRKEGYFDSLPRDRGYPKKLCFKFGPKSHGWKEYNR